MWRGLVAVCVALFGCGLGCGDDRAQAMGEEDGGVTTNLSGDQDGEAGTGPGFDMLPDPDLPPLPPDPPPIPQACEDAELGDTSVGCLFYAVDLDQHDGLAEDEQFSVIVTNVQGSLPANVTIEGKIDGQWQLVAGGRRATPTSPARALARIREARPPA